MIVFIVGRMFHFEMMVSSQQVYESTPIIELCGETKKASILITVQEAKYGWYLFLENNIKC